MKIQSIYIERFGRFQHYKQMLAQHPFLFIYGSNEAGKSTLMAFIKTMLFGFPKRSDMRPYLDGLPERTELGGTLTMDVPKQGTVVIERYRYKNNGRAILYFSDGQVTDEKPLKTWLSGYTLDIYESIFSFNLDGLRGIEWLKADRLNHYLFSTGMMGSANIFEIETNFEKQAQDLFRPNGKNPSINKLLIELEGVDKELSLWNEKRKDYNRWHSELAQNEDRLKQLSDEQQIEERKYEHYLKYKACEKLLIDFRTIMKELQETVSAEHFPDNGLKSYENWHATIVTLEGEQAGLRHRLEVIQDKVAALSIDYRFLINEERIYSLSREEEFLQTLESEYRMRLENLHLEQKEYDIQAQRLGDHDVERHLDAIETGLEINQNLKERLGEYERLQQHHQALEVEIEEKENKIFHFQETHEYHQKSLFSDQRYEELQAAVKQVQSGHGLSQEQARLEAQMEMVQRQQHMQKFLRLFKRLLSGGLFGVMGVVGVFLLLFGNLLTGWLLIGGGLCIGLVIWLGFRSLEAHFSVQESNSEALHQQLEKVQAMKTASQDDQIEEDYTLEKKRREQVELLHMHLQEERTSYQDLIARWEHLGEQVQSAYAKIQEWAQEHHFPINENVSVLLEVYDLIENLKERRLRIKHLQDQIEQYRQRFKEFEERFTMLKQMLNQSDRTLSELMKTLTLYKENRGKLDHYADSLQELMEQWEVIEEKLHRYHEECATLFQIAGVDNEQAFGRLAQVHEKRQALLKQKEALWSQLQHVVPQKDLREQCFEWMENDYWGNTEEGALLEKINKVKQEIGKVQEQMADLRSAIKQLEESSANAERIHDDVEIREQLKEKAKEWAIFRTAAEWLSKAKEVYRTTRLPKVLKQAGEYMIELTDGNYQQLSYTDEETFVLHHVSGQSFSLEQLSRGTKEQLYVCLRLALVAIFEAPYHLPLVIDDGFVNFDKRRRERTLALLSQLAGRRQILFLTCHDNAPIQGMEQINLHEERKGEEDVRFEFSHPSR